MDAPKGSPNFGKPPNVTQEGTGDKIAWVAPSRIISKSVWEFPKIRGTILGVPILRIILFWGLYWGPPILGNYHISHSLNS